MTRSPTAGVPTPDLSATPFALLDPAHAMRASQRFLSLAAETNAHAFEGLQRMQQQWLGFVAGRLEDDLATMRALAACRSAPEVWETSLKFWDRAGRQYAEEAEVVASETMTQAREGAEDLKREAAALAEAD
ncbi:phasin family protein [Albimonas pacifica]|uniref:Phasin protein n=1 Tax=Albimonas pacifica TaxID=1114924 RepID=A0A1I3D475_9RHOB|nr:phasin family protein [Albimonas pacifica]SFH81515.1 Phasin protein [Albimonas pacifica]